MHIRHVMWEFKKNNSAIDAAREFVFIAKVSLLTAKFETGLQSFVLAIRHWEINPD